MFKYLETLVYIFCFFPYTKFLPINLGSNLQPYTLMTSCFILLLMSIKHKKITLNKVSKLFLITLCISFVVLILDFIINYSVYQVPGVLKKGVQSIFYYLSGFLNYTVYYNIIKKNMGISMGKIYLIFSIWSIVAVIQKYIDKGFFSWTMNKVIISSDRGVISLSSEPSFYARMLIIFALIFFIQKKYLWVFLALFQTVFFAKSLLGIVYFIVSFLILVLFENKRILKIIVKILLMITLFFTLGNIIIKSGFIESHNKQRVVYLLNETIKDPLLVLKKRNSINFRIANVYYAIKGFKVIPNGYVSWESYFINELNKSSYFLLPLANESLRIKGMFGKVSYELGVFCAFLILGLMKISKEKKYKVLIAFYSIQTFGLTHPGFLFFLAYLSFISKSKKYSICYKNPKILLSQENSEID